MSQDFAIDLLAPPCLTLVFIGMSWVYIRSIRGGRPMTPVMRGMLLYGALFLLGMLYVFSAGAAFRLRGAWLVVGSGAWALILLGVAWWRHKHRTTGERQAPRRPIGRVLAQGLPMLVLLVCLIGAAIEWDFVAEEQQGHWLAALLWTAGVASSIALARRNRRAAVVTALRAFLGLLAIGALAQWSLHGLVAVGVTGLVLLLLEKLWRREPSAAGGSSMRGAA